LDARTSGSCKDGPCFNDDPLMSVVVYLIFYGRVRMAWCLLHVRPVYDGTHVRRACCSTGSSSPLDFDNFVVTVWSRRVHACDWRLVHRVLGLSRCVQGLELCILQRVPTNVLSRRGYHPAVMARPKSTHIRTDESSLEGSYQESRRTVVYVMVDC